MKQHMREPHCLSSISPRHSVLTNCFSAFLCRYWHLASTSFLMFFVWPIAISIIHFDHNHSIVACLALVLMWQLFHKCWSHDDVLFNNVDFFSVTDLQHQFFLCITVCQQALVILLYFKTLSLCSSLLSYSFMQILWLWPQYSMFHWAVNVKQRSYQTSQDCSDRKSWSKTV